MSMQDRSDMLTRIRNAPASNKPGVEMPASNLKLAIANVLKDEGYIADCNIVEKDKKKQLVLKLKYTKTSLSSK